MLSEKDIMLKTVKGEQLIQVHLEEEEECALGPGAGAHPHS